MIAPLLDLLKILPAWSKGITGWLRKGSVDGASAGHQPDQGMPAVHFALGWRLFTREFPAGFAEGDGLSNKPGLGTDAILFWPPVFGLGDALAVQFENQFRMTGLEKRRRNHLMTGNTGVGADIQVLQVAHAGSGAIGARVVRARVGAQPHLRRTMAAFTGDPFACVKIFTAEVFRNARKRSVTGGTSVVDGRVLDSEGITNLFCPGGGKGGRWSL